MAEKNTTKNNKSFRLIIVIAIAVFVAAYIIAFHIPRPIMWNWESISDYETIDTAGTGEIIDKTDKAETLNYENFLTLLENNGFAIGDELPEENDWFSVIGKIVVIDGAPFYVYEYASNSAMEKDSKYVGSSGYSINNTDAGCSAEIDWVSTPHWFKKDVLIVLYVGEDERIIDFLKETFGNVFAGG